MEIMEDGNLVDRVRILLQRDMQYYQAMQTVLKEALCIRVSGGKLDFPRYASFVAIKMVTWWEADFRAAFKRNSGLPSAGKGNTAGAEGEDGVMKKIQPTEFILLVVDTADQLLEHLHLLIQESLDHADLTVLTATLGAAALVRNCLWCYNQHAKNTVSMESSKGINKSYKSYHEMAEAVAERLLDLHCRLISLYVLNEADSLSWHSNKPFFERERCSYAIQMWWLYMQGTKADLWNTVPPKMAQRIFSGMLNESLSIIVTRFVHGRPSLERAEQFWTDAFNVLCCTGYLALGACTDSSEMIGTRLNELPAAIKDVHAKCNELLICLLLRGTPLKELYQIIRSGFDNLTILEPRRGPTPWLLICVPNILGTINSDVHVSSLPEDRSVILELYILRQQPQPNWPQVMKVLLMNDYAVAKMLLHILVRQCVGFTCRDDSDDTGETKIEKKNCGGFLCDNIACDQSFKTTPTVNLYCLIHILAMTVSNPDRVIIPALKQQPEWSSYLDRHQVWNQSRPPWLNAILNPLTEVMQPIIEILLEAVTTGASIYQAMSLIIGCFTELYVTVPSTILRTAIALNDNVPAHCHPIGGNVLLQILCAALYTALLEFSRNDKNVSQATPPSAKTNHESTYFDSHDTLTTAIALAEAICSIDEDNKHTAQIDNFFQVVKENIETANANLQTEASSKSCIIETRTDELLFTDTGRLSLKVTHDFLLSASDTILNNLRHNSVPNEVIDMPDSSIAKQLTYIMFHIEDTIFDQFLTTYDATNWKKLLAMPLSIKMERARSQILERPEFKNIADLSAEDREAVHCIKQHCSSVRTAHFQ